MSCLFKSREAILATVCVGDYGSEGWVLVLNSLKMKLC